MVETSRDALVSALKSINADPEIALSGRSQQIKVPDIGKIFQFRTIDTYPKRVLSQDVFQRAIEYEDTGVADIMEALNVGKRSAKITYYRFTFNILESLKEVITLLKRGYSIRNTAKLTGSSISTVQRIKNQFVR